MTNEVDVQIENATKMLMGHSLSSCVGQILSGKVKLKHVLRIDAGTRITSLQDLNSVFLQYQWCAWEPYRLADAIEIVEQLLFTGRLHQARVHGRYTGRPDGEIWTKATKADIAWRDHLTGDLTEPELVAIEEYGQYPAYSGARY